MTEVYVYNPLSAVVHFQDEANLVLVEARVTQVEISDIGIPGPAGAAAGRFVFSQPSALNSWVVNHNLGYRPSSVRVLSVGGVEVDGAVVDTTDNQLVISFALPISGSAVIA